MADAIGAPFTAIFGEDVDPDYLAWVSATVPQYKQKVLAAYPNWESVFSRLGNQVLRRSPDLLKDCEH